MLPWEPPGGQVPYNQHPYLFQAARSIQRDIALPEEKRFTEGLLVANEFVNIGQQDRTFPAIQ